MVAHAKAGGSPAADSATPNRIGVAEVIDKFLDWCQTHRAPRTYEWYRQHLQNFLDVSGAGRLAVGQLKPFHVVEWVDSHGGAWSPACRRGAIIAVQRPFNWAAKLGYVPATPLPFVEKPKAQRREQALSATDWGRIKASYPAGDPFVELLEFCWETGARPQEAKAAAARHYDAKGRRVVFPAAEAKGKRKVRVIHLTARAAELLDKQFAERPGGILFVNQGGVPWTAYSMSNRFARLKERLGGRFNAYSIRHSFCQRMLEKGIDHLTVAELMGHRTGRWWPRSTRT